MSSEKNLSTRHDKIKRLAKSYVPEWRFDEQNPDAGSTVALLVDDMLCHTEENFARVMDKHKIQYLNLFDMLKEEPITSAKSYVKITPVAGAPEPVVVPRATTLLADDGSDNPIAFETDYAITTTEANVRAIYAAGKDSDRLTCLYSGTNTNDLKDGVKLFDLTGDNQSEHRLLLGFEQIFDDLTDVKLGLKFTTLEELLLPEVLEFLSGEDVRYSFLKPEGEWDLPRATLKDEFIWLDVSGYQPGLVTIDEKEYYVLCVSSSKICDVHISGVGLVFSEKSIPPKRVMTAGIEQNISRFAPFQTPLAIYSECGIESGSVLSRRGASVEMKFNLDFEIIEQDLPSYDVDDELKVIMKREGTAPTLQKMDVRADYVLIEYLSTTGWKRLLHEEHITGLFNGSVVGAVNINFTCPADMASVEEATDGYRLRLRLMRADNLYSIPNRVFCPIISELNFAYSYDNAAVTPDIAQTKNNFEIKNVTGLLGRKRSIELFYTRESERLCMYFGFDLNPTGSPTSLYFEVENSEDIPVNYMVQYLGRDGFSPIQTVDYTGGFLYTGNILMLIPDDIRRKEMFANNLYWLRIVSLDINPSDNPPRIKSIIPNMVRAHNHRTRTQEFYLEEEQGNIRLQLPGTNLIKVEVYVNEHNEHNPTVDNWVLWTKRSHFSERARHYLLDLAQGTVEFDKNIFAAYPLSSSGASVRIVYQSYEGSRANVRAGAINQTEQSLKYISMVSNPVPAYGGYDGYNVESSAKHISNILKTRNRAVTAADYFDIISQISYCVKRIKCVSGINKLGEKDEDLLTIALLIEEFEKGNHIFSSVKDEIYKKLCKTGNIIPMGKKLMLTQPHFVPFSIRIWVLCSEYDDVYELQNNTKELIREFIDPLNGGFDGSGWSIGTLPTVKQLSAYLKMKCHNISIVRISAAATTGGREIAVGEDVGDIITNPFAMAVNGSHTVYVEVK